MKSLMLVCINCLVERLIGVMTHPIEWPIELCKTVVLTHRIGVVFDP